MASDEPFARALPRLLGLHLTIARRRMRVQRGQQFSRYLGDFVDRALEGCGVLAGGLVESRQLAHELQRRGADLILRRRRLEIEQRLNVTAHRFNPSGSSRPNIVRPEKACYSSAKFIRASVTVPSRGGSPCLYRLSQRFCLRSFPSRRLPRTIRRRNRPNGSQRTSSFTPVMCSLNFA